MTESARLERAEPPPEGHFALEIAALRGRGADRIDPVRFHFIEALARRALEHQGPVRRILEERLGEALASCEETFEQARSTAQEQIARLTAVAPEAAGELQRLFEGGDLRGVSRLLARLEKPDRESPMAGLAAYLVQCSAANGDGAEEGGSRAELKTLRNFRSTWSRLSADKQLRKSIEEGPENAGPLNSHRLVLNSLALMRDVSPDYLNRFMTYVDTLLWLDQADKDHRPAVKKTLAGKATRK